MRYAALAILLSAISGCQSAPMPGDDLVCTNRPEPYRVREVLSAQECRAYPASIARADSAVRASLREAGYAASRTPLVMDTAETARGGCVALDSEGALAVQVFTADAVREACVSP